MSSFLNQRFPASLTSSFSCAEYYEDDELIEYYEEEECDDKDLSSVHFHFEGIDDLDFNDEDSSNPFYSAELDEDATIFSSLTSSNSSTASNASQKSTSSISSLKRSPPVVENLSDYINSSNFPASSTTQQEQQPQEEASEDEQQDYLSDMDEDEDYYDEEINSNTHYSTTSNYSTHSLPSLPRAGFSLRQPISTMH